MTAAENGEIKIWFEQGDEEDNFNYLHIKNVAAGIHIVNDEKIFGLFYSEYKAGTGLGLAYYKL